MYVLNKILFIIAKEKEFYLYNYYHIKIFRVPNKLPYVPPRAPIP